MVGGESGGGGRGDGEGGEVDIDINIEALGEMRLIRWGGCIIIVSASSLFCDVCIEDLFSFVE